MPSEKVIRRRKSKTGRALGSLRRLVLAPVVASGGLLGVAGCSEPSGEIVLVVSTDMSIPKDIDAIRITVRSGDKRFLDIDYPFGAEQLKLPGTLGVVGEAGQPLTISAAGLKDGVVRVMREVQTRVPDVHESMLRLPLHWLCEGSVIASVSGEPACPDGQMCFAGRCASNGVDSSLLPPFSEAEVFGGGSGSGVDGACFDTTACFDNFILALPEHENGAPECTIPAPPGIDAINVALWTEVDGVCGPKGCFVPLDHGSREGISWVGSRVKLPPALCDHTIPGKVLAVVVSAGCAPKMESTPTCGPWSLAGKADPPSPSDPMTLAAGQKHPAGIAVTGGRVFWTNAREDGTVKSVPIEGGPVVEFARGQAYPSAIAADAKLPFVYWINDGSGEVMRAPADGQGDAERLIAWPGARSALAAFGSDLYFSSSDGRILQISTSPGGAVTQIAAGQGESLRIAVDGTGVYWTDSEKGRVMRLPSGEEFPKELVSDQINPLGIFVGGGSVYWVNAGPQSGVEYVNGTLATADLNGVADVLVGEEPNGGLQMPYAITGDGETIYWANRGDGSIMKVSTSGDGLDELASGQSNPVAIAVDATHVYWTNAGSSKNSFNDGSIMRVAK